MSSVDDRIVNMQFNSKQFQQGATDSIKTLDKLEGTISKTAKSKGLNDLGKSADGVRGRFSAMQVAGVAAVATIASKATIAAGNMLKAFTIDPIVAGFQEYTTNLNSVQTIMANTGKSVKTVNKYLDELNTYADETIYNFSEMARNIGTFTAAGVKLGEATSSIKGIANLAALSGSSSQQASTAMYQLSQAIAAGRVGLQDWNSVVNAGMGGKIFQQALARTAENMGTLTEGAAKLNKETGQFMINGQAFRQTISTAGGNESWLTGKVLTNTLAQLSGDISKADLALQGFSAKQIKDIVDLQETAFNAATKIKSLPQLIGVVKESMGSMFAAGFRAILGDFNQSKNLWSKVGFSLLGPGGTITNIQKGFLEMVNGWVKAGGRVQIIHAFTHGFKTLGAIMSTLKGAWQDVFPPSAISILSEMSRGFNQWMKRIQNHVASGGTLDSLRSIFGGIFAALHIGLTVLNGVRTAFMSFFRQLFINSTGASSGVLDLLASVGEFIKKIDKSISSGGDFVKMLGNIGGAAGDMARQGIEIAGGIVGGIIEGLGINWGALQTKVVELASEIPEWFMTTLGIHSPATALIPVGANIVLGILEGIASTAQTIGRAIGELAGNIIANFMGFFRNLDPLQLASLMNTVFTGAMLLSMRQLIKTAQGFAGIYGKIGGAFDELGNTLKTFQTGIRAQALMSIAIAVALLTGSLIALSFVDPEKIGIGLGAIAAMMGTLVMSLLALSKIQKGEEGFNLIAMSTALIGVATAVVLLTGAVAALGNMDLKTLGKGIGSIAIIMGILILAFLGFSKIKGSIEGMAASILIIAIAMNLLAAAVLAFGMMDVKTLAKGLGAMAVGLGMIVLAMVGMDRIKGSVEGLAASILIISVAMVVLAAAVAAFGAMSWEELAKGLGSIAIGLGLFIGAFALMAPMTAQITILAPAILLMSLAMVALATAVTMLGNLSLEQLGKGLGAIAAGFAILLAAAAIAPYVAPGLILLSVVMVSLGQGLALAGLGMLAFGTGFAIMAAAGTAGVAVLIVAFQAFMAMLPTFAIQVAASVVAFVQAIAEAAPKLRKAFSKIFAEMLGVIQDAIPKVGKLLQTFINTAIRIVVNSASRWAEAGMTIIENFMGSVEEHVPDIVDHAMNIVTKFMDVIAQNVGPLADSAAKMIIAFINGIADAINNNIDDMREAGLNLAHALINGMTGGLLDEGVAMVRHAAETIADALPGWMRKVLGINSPSKVTWEIGKFVGAGLAGGIEDSTKATVAAAEELGRRAGKGVADGLAETRGLVDAAVAGANASLTADGPSLVGLQNTSRNKQKLADEAAGNLSNATFFSDIAERASNKAQNEADKARKLADKKIKAEENKKGKPNKARIKAINKVANQAQNKANAKANASDKKQKAEDAAQAAYDRAQAVADAAAQAVEDERTFIAADLQGKGDIKLKASTDLAAQAQARLAKADAENKEAAKLEGSKKKSDQEQAKKLRERAKADAAAAAQLAQASIDAKNAALGYFQQARAEAAKAVRERITTVIDSLRAADQARKDDAEFKAAKDPEKSNILLARAVENDKKEKAAREEMQRQLNIAESLADTDAEGAQAALDRADEQAQIASAAADAAIQQREQSADILKKIEEDQKAEEAKAREIELLRTSLRPSRTALEDAASAVDSYTASQQQATDLIGATPGAVNYYQNNYSPVALTPSEVYRQSKNLLSAAEIKMGAATGN